MSPGLWQSPGLPPMDCFYPSIPPSVGAATSCQLTPGTRHKSNQQLPASLGLPRPQAAQPSHLQAPSCTTAARSGTPGLPSRPPALRRQQIALALATGQPADPGRKPDSRYCKGSGHPGLAPLRVLPAILLGPDLQRGSHLKRHSASYHARMDICPPEAFPSRGSFWGRCLWHLLAR